ncbi:MAG: hypothetical protein PF692_00575, partial [Kiritimatiellae bacterium]|nr:hypothetical protein [Kiritimatiellia bacterium]
MYKKRRLSVFVFMVLYTIIVVCLVLFIKARSLKVNLHVDMYKPITLFMKKELNECKSQWGMPLAQVGATYGGQPFFLRPRTPLTICAYGIGSPTTA